jgi:hypothetical protein
MRDFNNPARIVNIFTCGLAQFEKGLRKHVDYAIPLQRLS